MITKVGDIEKLNHKLGGRRLIKTVLPLLLVILFLFPSSVGQCQTRKLPRASFQSYSSGLQPSSAAGAGASSTYNRPTSAGLPYSPGLHLTESEERTSQNASTPYNPGEPSLNMALVRWQRNRMPLLVWISPGLKLPDEPVESLQNVRPSQVHEMLKSETPFSDLQEAKGWTPETNYLVASGIDQWKQFESEGLIKFGYTTDPKQAHILVFFVDQFQGAAGPGGTNVGGNTCAKIFTADEARILASQGLSMAVVIELSTSVNYEPEKMQAASAHEFGHALGIKAHSPYRDDIMFENRNVTTLSEGDKNTLRFLYKAQPQYVMW